MSSLMQQTDTKQLNGSPKIWVNAGEISGDMHGAALLAALKARLPGVRCVGMGGPALEGAGMQTLFRVEELSVMGFVEVLGKLPKIFKLLRGIKAALEREKPDLLICVDAPSFNFRVIKVARALGIPVVYYISPKIWAWGKQRGHFLRDNVQRLISILPFEPECYQKNFDMQVDYVGNPLLDMVLEQKIEDIKPQRERIGLLPGSRCKEIESLMPRFAGAAKLLQQAASAGKLGADFYNGGRRLEFHCVAAPGVNPEKLRALWLAGGGLPDDLHMHGPEERYRLLRSCRVLFAASGTASLECALLSVPTLITYVVSPLTFFLGKIFVRVKYVGLPNLILGRELFPELLQEDCLPEPLAEAALRWLANDSEHSLLEGALPRPWRGSAGPLPLAEVEAGLGVLRLRMGEAGAIQRAAGVVVEELQKLGKCAS